MYHKCIIILFLLEWTYLYTLCSTKLTEYDSRSFKTALVMKENTKDGKEPIALNANTFKELVLKSKTFVDNSLLILEILQDPSHRTFQWIGPSGLGKSINLDMLKVFFEIQVDKYGNRTSIESSNNYNVFVNGEITPDGGKVQKLNAPLLISKYTDIMSEYHGQFPVIFVSFKHVTGENSTTTIQKIRHAIGTAFEQHEYLINVLREKCQHQTSGTWCKNLQKFQNYLHAEDQVDIEDSLVFLTQLLESHFDRKSIVLLDDFHVPVFQYLQHDDLFTDDWKQVFDLMEKLLFATFEKQEIPIRLGIISGTFKLQYSDSSKKCFVAQKTERLHEYFGLSQAHMYSLINQYKISNDLKKSVFRWYNGYHSVISKQSFCTPISVARFLKCKEIATYGKEFTQQDYIQKVITRKFEFRFAVLSLLSKREPEIHDDNRYYWFDGRFEDLRNLLRHETRQASFHEMKSFFWYFLSEGYLYRLPDAGKAKLLNIEIANILTIRMIFYYKQTYNINERLLQKAAMSLNDFTRIMSKANASSSTLLENSLTLLYANTFNDSSNVMDKHSYLSVFYCAILRMQAIAKFDVDVYYNRTFIPVIVRCDVDLVIVDNTTKQAIIIVLDYDNLSANDACHYAWYQREIFLTHKYIRNLKFIGINIFLNKTVQVLQNQMEWWTSDEESDPCVFE